MSQHGLSWLPLPPAPLKPESGPFAWPLLLRGHRVASFVEVGPVGLVGRVHEHSRTQETHGCFQRRFLRGHVGTRPGPPALPDSQGIPPQTHPLKAPACDLCLLTPPRPSCVTWSVPCFTSLSQLLVWKKRDEWWLQHRLLWWQSGLLKTINVLFLSDHPDFLLLSFSVAADTRDRADRPPAGYMLTWPIMGGNLGPVWILGGLGTLPHGMHNLFLLYVWSTSFTRCPWRVSHPERLTLASASVFTLMIAMEDPHGTRTTPRLGLWQKRSRTLPGSSIPLRPRQRDGRQVSALCSTCKALAWPQHTPQLQPQPHGLQGLAPILPEAWAFSPRVIFIYFLHWGKGLWFCSVHQWEHRFSSPVSRCVCAHQAPAVGAGSHQSQRCWGQVLSPGTWTGRAGCFPGCADDASSLRLQADDGFFCDTCRGNHLEVSSSCLLDWPTSAWPTSWPHKTSSVSTGILLPIGQVFPWAPFSVFEKS